MKKISQQKWQKKLKELDEVADKLGHGIDEGIKEAVALLNLAGINTIASCEGHKSWGNPYPWIDIACVNYRELVEQLRKIKDVESKEFNELADRITKLNLRECRKLYKLLKDFYPQSDTNIKAMLIIDSYGHGSGRLQSRQEYLFEGDKESYRRHARFAKAEMSRFTDFLKRQILT